jgi:hypothetical protein
MGGDGTQIGPVIRRQAADRDATQIVCLLEDRLEHWPGIAGRAVDHGKHLGQRRLACQRCIAFGAQPRNDGLRIGHHIV